VAHDPAGEDNEDPCVDDADLQEGREGGEAYLPAREEVAGEQDGEKTQACLDIRQGGIERSHGMQCQGMHEGGCLAEHIQGVKPLRPVQ